jgi:hypothetical protein
VKILLVSPIFAKIKPTSPRGIMGIPTASFIFKGVDGSAHPDKNFPMIATTIKEVLSSQKKLEFNGRDRRSRARPTATKNMGLKR